MEDIFYETIKPKVQKILPCKINKLVAGEPVILSLCIVSIKEINLDLVSYRRCNTVFSDGDEYIILEEIEDSKIAGRFNEGDTVDLIMFGCKRQKTEITMNERKLKLENSPFSMVRPSDSNITEHKCYSVYNFFENELEQKTLVDIECVVGGLEKERNSVQFDCIDRKFVMLFIKAKLPSTVNFGNKDAIRIKRCVIQKVKGQMLISSCESSEIEIIENFQGKPDIEIHSEGLLTVNKDLTWANIENKVTSGRSIHFTADKRTTDKGEIYLSLIIMDNAKAERRCQVFNVICLEPLIKTESLEHALAILNNFKDKKIDINIEAKHSGNGNPAVYFKVQSLVYNYDQF